MKKIMTPEVELINLECNDILCGPSQNLGRSTVGGGNENSFVSSRGYYDYYDDDEEW